jgi:hypothetical protein
MGTDLSEWIAHPVGEQLEVEEWSAVAETFAGRVHIEWDTTAPVTPLGQLPFFIEYLKQGGLVDGWVADCQLLFTSPNAPRKRDVLGTPLLSVLAGHEWLSDNGPPYTARETRALAHEIGLEPCTTPIESPRSNGMAEAFVKTLKRDCARVNPRRDAASVLRQLDGWFEHYNTIPSTQGARLPLAARVQEAAGGCHPSDRLTVAAVQCEGDPDPLAIVAADLKPVRAPPGIRPIDGDAAIMPPLLTHAGMALEQQPMGFHDR